MCQSVRHLLACRLHPLRLGDLEEVVRRVPEREAAAVASECDLCQVGVMSADVAVTAAAVGAAVGDGVVAGAAESGNRTIETDKGPNADDVETVDAAVADSENDRVEAAEATPADGLVTCTAVAAAGGRCLCEWEALVDDEHRSYHGRRVVAGVHRRSHRSPPSAAVHLVSEGATAALAMVWQVRM